MINYDASIRVKDLKFKKEEVENCFWVGWTDTTFIDSDTSNTADDFTNVEMLLIKIIDITDNIIKVNISAKINITEDFIKDKLDYLEWRIYNYINTLRAIRKHEGGVNE